MLTVGLCRVLHDPKGKLPTLWDALAFTGAGSDAWGEKLAQVWALRQQLVATYPEQIFKRSTDMHSSGNSPLAR